MSKKHGINKNIERIKRRKKQRQAKAYIRLGLVLMMAVAIILLAVFAVTSVMRFIENRKPVLKPEPVNLMSYNAEKLDNTENENFVYVDALQKPVKHVFDGTVNRLSSIKSVQGKKVCYLTFDDGPNLSITPQILDVLRKYDVKATFFQVGTLIESNRDMARRVFEEGHLIANHSYSHNYKNLYASPEAFMSEIQMTENLIKSVLDSEADYFPIIRFPGGSHNVGAYKEQKQIIKENLESFGIYYCDWNTLNGDAEGARKSADELFEYFKKYTDTKKNAVVLMHDAVNKQATVEVLPRIIEYMSKHGYIFLRLDEN